VQLTAQRSTLRTMNPALSADAVEQAARKLLDGRVDAARQLVTAQQAVTDIRRRHQDELAEAEHRHAQALDAAQSAGWTLVELKELGFEVGKPTARPRRRTRNKVAVPTATAAPQPDQES
jgi:hypothetical protein